MSKPTTRKQVALLETKTKLAEKYTRLAQLAGSAAKRQKFTSRAYRLRSAANAIDIQLKTEEARKQAEEEGKDKRLLAAKKKHGLAT